MTTDTVQSTPTPPPLSMIVAPLVRSRRRQLGALLAAFVVKVVVQTLEDAGQLFSPEWIVYHRVVHDVGAGGVCEDALFELIVLGRLLLEYLRHQCDAIGIPSGHVDGALAAKIKGGLRVDIAKGSALLG
jgi:hypothetical protein